MTLGPDDGALVEADLRVRVRVYPPRRQTNHSQQPLHPTPVG